MKLFVGNLAFKANEDELRDHFEQAGYKVTEVKIIHDPDTGRSKGYGFVTMEDGFTFAQVQGDLNGTSLAGRQITISEANPPRAKAGGRRF